jgi:hypothetical protein
MKLRENIELFKHFKKYSEEDGIFMIKIIKKASKSQFFYHNLDILLSQAKSFDRMPLKEVADLPMNNLIVSKAAEDKRTKHHTYQKDFKLEEDSDNEKSYEIGEKTLPEGQNRFPVIKKGNVKNKSKSKGKNEKNLIIIVRKKTFLC